jgi:uncharacterized protein (TIGR02246 family)
MNHQSLTERAQLMQSATLSPEATAADVARDVLARLESAWNAGDGAAFGAVYADDASFVTIRGEHIVGATAIGAGHAGIFATIYRGSVNRMELVRAEQVAPGTVLALSVNTLDCPTGPLAGVHQALSTSLLVRDADGAWHASLTHNTLVAA